MNYRKWWLLGLGFALLLATISPLASKSPDGLEKVAGQQGFIDQAAKSPFQVVAGYLFPGIHNETLATIVAGWLGVLVVFGVVYFIGRLISRKRT
ncbi:cobalt/nickel transport system permease protein/cobalt/nickel transport protein [Dehalogenimonas formicexedens]|uniref:Cobalt/nickel transport system permease protein/cobalt/nickel transport protein n=1 Tax=Dehalogenimonas formicexedens TaxID=1839801 RepID=A0A1P8F4K5_9CHLR|nr:PDGLE domain-containing protein [Dehalogenimonas formicexedens]APV43370.1 cobalt/nickel transport system permease protein/cobalt/nickel transport protein [Dehalogenimonas formicexedens]